MAWGAQWLPSNRARVEEAKLLGDRAIPLIRHILENEPALPAQLRLSLESGPTEPDQLPFRKGHAIAWIEDALAPLRERMPARELRRLVLATHATTGIEAHVWLTDAAGVPRQEAAELMRSSARALLRDACRDRPGADQPIPELVS